MVAEANVAGPPKRFIYGSAPVPTVATRRRRRRWAMLAGFLLLIVLALAAAYLLGDANSGEESEGAAAVACSGDSVT